MSTYVLIVTSDSIAPVNMPSYIENLENEDLTSFEILGKLYEHKAIFVKPKASQLAILRSVSALSSIDMVFFLPEEESVSITFTTEMSGLPRLTNVAAVEAMWQDEKGSGAEETNSEEDLADDETEDEDVSLFPQGE